MNGRKNLTPIHSADRDFTVHPRAFVIFDRITGTQRFEVKANPDGSLPVNHIASLLAVHCVMRGQTPKEFGVMVVAGEDLLNGLGKRAEKLIQDCQMFQSSVKLTRRQEEILHEVLQSLSNKEIAGKMNISARTVKFHISALLEKFGVTDRMGLMRGNADRFSTEWISTAQAVPQLMADAELANGHASANAGERRVQANALERRSCR